MFEITQTIAGATLGFRRHAEDEAPRIAGAPRPGAAARQRPAVAYLSNVYPKISHSFIRTEIAALERQGVEVHRFTVRRAPEALGDRDETARTTALLEDRAALAAAVLAQFAMRPLQALRALALALRGAGGIRALAYFAEAALLARRLERAGVAHVHAHFGTNPAMVVRLAARLAPVTYSFTAHGPDEFDAPRGLDLPGKIAEAAFVVGVSSFGRGQLMRWSDPAHWPRIHVVPCAPDPVFLADPGPAADDPPEDARFLCVARLSAQKGLPLLLEAVARIAADRAIRLDIVGDGEDRAIIEGQIARLGLGAVVTLRGWAGPEAIRAALVRARALVLPSFAEGLPVVLMEAMALRRPVIATAIAGIPELVDGQVGWLVPSGSVDALAQALEAALGAWPEELAAMGERASRRVRERHDPERCAARMVELLRPFAGR
ncbi:glycosyltransferase [Novosphingobium resinovorum]|uniref:glycosyltransferase n=1 Tax=Novosphingobium resinovorum TaxID=158500 RepID=UPI002ED3301D|nr:glycosyltransferase [Novosphingobium resinovorum]